MSENNINEYPVMQKQMHAAGTPFKVINKEPRDHWQTNYAYYMKCLREGIKPKPLLARYNGDQLQVYIDGEWENKDLWDDFSEAVVDKDNNPVLNAKGNQRRRTLISQTKEYLVEFEVPVSIEVYNKDTKQTDVKEVQTVWIRLSTNLSGKLEKEINDKRNGPDTYFMINYDSSKSPAEQYDVVFHH